MAILRTYKCSREGCGFTVLTTAQGHYRLMYDYCYNFRCEKCKNIIEVSAEEIGESSCGLECNECGADGDYLYPWNPTEGMCPKCGARMKLDERGEIVCAD